MNPFTIDIRTTNPDALEMTRKFARETSRVVVWDGADAGTGLSLSAPVNYDIVAATVKARTTFYDGNDVVVEVFDGSYADCRSKSREYVEAMESEFCAYSVRIEVLP